MTEQEVKQKAQEIMEKHHIGTLATVKNDKPHTRYMTFFNRDFTLYTPTDEDTHKTDEIEENPNVHILIGYEGDGYEDPYLEIEGKATMRKDKEIKQDIWNDQLNRYFEGPEDQNMVVLEIKPSIIRLMNDGKETPQTIPFK
ncbi:general stress protein [Pontibacillus halophilus JSM 076056 = DSM 19796]|uniref:General stress protein n=1 Tax=Pontibacillus halophilus JSM 076056 = DSM 19796 TaxID=1385510 RepID=A0A0A5GMM3_9BACI|nr:pyridoxamine 5'-phosphate oxidase family protein [Pontibacillus halophilus]KGX92473.1 general stress protein [Pontibacillus halophilus JSM 076056 = DSM 19796]